MTLTGNLSLRALIRGSKILYGEERKIIYFRENEKGELVLKIVVVFNYILLSMICYYYYS